MDRDAVIAWFADYLDTFAACTRGERDTSTMLDYYAVPMVFTMDTGVHALASREEVLAAAQQQVDGLRSASTTTPTCSTPRSRSSTPCRAYTAATFPAAASTTARSHA